MNETLERAKAEGRWCRWGCGLQGCRNCHPTARAVRVDGFPYTTTAPERTPADHYRRLREQAEGVERLAGERHD